MNRFPDKFPRPNMTASARNLRKSDLGGAIFGCKNSTMKECLEKQLFGVPSPHFSYVKNIEHGLPLFLFNYSDRKLYGIYEAASHGQMYIDSYAWTDSGREKTAFPAQVRIRIRMQCHPLAEKLYYDIIKDNYYTPQHFLFELDHAQTKGLMALFVSSPSPSNTIVAPNRFPVSPCKKWKVAPKLKRPKFESGDQKLDPQTSAGSMNPIKYGSLDHEEIEDGSSSRSTSDLEENDFIEPALDSGTVWMGENNAHSHADVNPHPDGENPPGHDLSKDPNGACNERKFSAQNSDLDGIDTVLMKLRELFDTRLHSVPPSKVSMVDCQRPINVHEGQENTTISDLDHGNIELVKTITELKETTVALQKKQVESDKDMEKLMDIVQGSVKVIGELKGQVQDLERKLLVSGSSNKILEQYLGVGKFIYLIGGYDGTSWLSSLDSFSPASDVLKPLKPMSSTRSYASAVTLNGNIYAIGGGNGSSSLATVECYSPRDNEWTLCPNLNRPKGSLAGAILNGKIFAIGGGDSNETFNDVEMLDPVLGRWLITQPMLQKRFATAAAELNGVIYAVGGYDGRVYMDSVERYDPREPYWTRVASMNSRRGSHSLAILNDKLYAVGGHDSVSMVPSVEFFDPRLGSWMMTEPMSTTRGYAAAAVLGDSLFVVGGVDSQDNIMGNVECYKEGAGWTLVDFRSIGLRCVLSAVVL